MMMTSSRPTWDEWGLNLAWTVSERADCSRLQVGAVIMLPDHTIVATGYNGAPSGQPGCLTEKACPRASSEVLPGSSYDTGPGACIAVHAEMNALLRASWDQQKDATLYSTERPCDGCMKMIAGSRIKRVKWPDGEWWQPHRFDLDIHMLVCKVCGQIESYCKRSK